ncbi:ABC transporter ATP-binding protein [Rhodohalobacter sulfatireducens]|uniref:ABC transporter ATP-binding protein/permease n=1 Tax=Rhodohalobacter sulfatireducens TaxID=2911366 RepID=A0ABS9KFQ8_9BACT|nr:ABC transporter ATP-binding protein [Rhodohalobacter sulfatireducens]MCG2589694.1 ABC transporter ATP-binding protein/permease [Rhodohalobacter sulfatireducens]
MQKNPNKGQHPLAQLLSYLKPYRKKVRLATLFSVLNKLFDLAPPILIGVAVDIVVEGQESLLGRYGISDPADQLLFLAGVTAVIWIFESIFEYMFKIYWRDLAQFTQDSLRTDTYSHLQEQEMAYFEDRSSGDLIAILNDDVNQLERFLDHGANDLIQVFITVVVIGSIFVFSAPQIGWMALVPMPFIIWGSVWFQEKLAPKYSKVRDQAGEVSSQLVNNLGGMTTIKSFGAQDHENKRIANLSDQYKKANQDVIRLSSAFVPLIRMLIMAGFIAILIFAGFQTLDGEMQVGLYSVLIFVTQRLLWPLTRLGETFDLYQRAMASTRRIMGLLNTEEKLPDGTVPIKPQQVEGEYKFENVNFRYRSGGPVLKNMNLTIGAGDTVGIVGATGAGKSSMVKLLMRFYDVTGGQILLDGRDIREYKINDLVKSAGLVSQDVFLFHGSVIENIRYGSFDASKEDVIRAAEMAEAHDFIMELDEEYDTIVGERGQKLSGGQRQRISIARAILKNPPILILDEATSAVDNETEAAIQRSLFKISKDRTTIIIAHRLSTVRHADHIFVLEDGELAESGTHNELISKDGIYHQLWKVQSGEITV